ncbi:MAG: PRC-barrel domain-containing protein [Endomicrobiales bacterium]|jgi:16S rRNA processing protein RimM
MWNTVDIVGCSVVTEEGQLLGILADVLPSKAHDIWVVKSAPDSTDELLIPALKTIVLTVDPSEKKIVVALPPGLADIYR